MAQGIKLSKEELEERVLYTLENGVSEASKALGVSRRVLQQNVKNYKDNLRWENLPFEVEGLPSEVAQKE